MTDLVCSMGKSSLVVEAQTESMPNSTTSTLPTRVSSESAHTIKTGREHANERKVITSSLCAVLINPCLEQVRCYGIDPSYWEGDYYQPPYGFSFQIMKVIALSGVLRS